MSNPEVIGLLLNYRDAARSIRCVRSLLDNNVERVLVWDNSADGGVSAAELIRAFGRDSCIDVHVSPNNIGFAAGVNRALERCTQIDRRARVLLINNDATLLPRAVTLLLEALVQKPEARIALPSINHGGKVIGRGYYHRLTGLLSTKAHMGFFCYPSGCCLLIDHERLDGPLFDEDFYMYGEDIELGWRLGQHPGFIADVKEVLVEHEGSASSGLGTPFYETRMVAAHLILVRKLARNRTDQVALLLGHAAMLIARSVVRSIRYRSMVPLSSLCRGRRLARQKPPLLTNSIEQSKKV